MQNYLNHFADLGSFDPDAIFELYASISSINGVTVTLYDDLMLFELFGCPVLALSAKHNYAAIYTNPDGIISLFEDLGFFPFEADPYLEACDSLKTEDDILENIDVLADGISAISQIIKRSAQ